jgi:hypothetical protein
MPPDSVLMLMMTVGVVLVVVGHRKVGIQVRVAGPHSDGLGMFMVVEDVLGVQCSCVIAGRVCRWVWCSGQVYFVSSQRHRTAERIQRAVREHWAVENGLH